jgi:hypothetical protein
MSEQTSLNRGRLLQQPLQLLRIAACLACIASGLLDFGIELYGPGTARLKNFVQTRLTGILPFWLIAIIELLGNMRYGWALWRITRDHTDVHIAAKRPNSGGTHTVPR